MDENYNVTRFVPGQIWMMYETESESFSSRERVHTLTKKRPHVVISVNRLRVLAVPMTTRGENQSLWRIPFEFEDRRSFIIADEIACLKMNSLNDADYVTTVSKAVLKDIVACCMTAIFNGTFSKEELQEIVNTTEAVSASHEHETEPRIASAKDVYLERLVKQTPEEIPDNIEVIETPRFEITSKTAPKKRAYHKILHTTDAMIENSSTRDLIEAIFITDGVISESMTEAQMFNIIKELTGTPIQLSRTLAEMRMTHNIYSDSSKYFVKLRSNTNRKRKTKKDYGLMSQHYSKYGLEFTAKIWGYSIKSFQHLIGKEQAKLVKEANEKIV